MFSFFKRTGSAPAAPAKRFQSLEKKRSTNPRNVDFLSPLPVPQVTEGNLDSDWAMWEDSVLEQDSQMPSQFADTVPSQLDPIPSSELDSGLDPFAQVSKHAP